MTEQTYDVILSDPPWPYQMTKAKASLRRLDQSWRFRPICWSELMDMRYPSHEGTIIYVWCTAPLLPTQLEFMATKCSLIRVSMVWVKRTVRSADFKFNPGTQVFCHVSFLINAPS